MNTPIVFLIFFENMCVFLFHCLLNLIMRTVRCFFLHIKFNLNFSLGIHPLFDMRKEIAGSNHFIFNLI